MIWLYILLGIVLFIALVMFIPITLRASYKEKFWCAVYIGFVKLQLVPAKPKKEKKKKKAKKEGIDIQIKEYEQAPHIWIINNINKQDELQLKSISRSCM